MNFLKNTIFVLLMLGAVIASQAQSLTGKTWVYNIPDEDAVAQFVFNDNGTMVMTISGNVEDAVQLKVTIPGTYKKHTKRLCIKLDTKNTEIDLSSLHDDGSITEADIKRFKDNFKQDFLNDKSLSKKQMLRIKKFTESYLEITNTRGVSTVFNAQ